jgi:hypothetical protein
MKKEWGKTVLMLISRIKRKVPQIPSEIQITSKNSFPYKSFLHKKQITDPDQQNRNSTLQQRYNSNYSIRTAFFNLDCIPKIKRIGKTSRVYSDSYACL